jgi:uncharacterized protein YecE (DUF72 family)
VERRKFVYAIKASELITHVKGFTGTKTLVRDFGHIADMLGPHMRCFLFQLPPIFHFTQARLERMLTQWTRPGETSWSSGTAVGGMAGRLPECPRPRDSLLRAPRDLRLRAASRQPHGPGETAGFFATLIRLPQNITGTGRGDSPNIRFAVCKGR